MTRYLRQEVFKKIGPAGQKKLSKATVGIIGLGGVGSPAAFYLAGAGLNLVLIDGDTISKSDLNRQVFYAEHQVGKPKATEAKDRLSLLNPDIKIEAHPISLDSNNLDLLKKCDFIIDGTDNFETRYLINVFCVKNKIPFSYGGAVEDRGMVSTFVPGGPCLKCLFPKPPKDCQQTCEQVGIFGPVAGIVGLWQASEAIKSISGFGKLLKSKLLTINLSTNKTETVEYEKTKNCPCQGKR